MARRRLQARVNWAVRWGGPTFLAVVLLAYLLTPGGYFVSYGSSAGRLYQAGVHQGAVVVDYLSGVQGKGETGWHSESRIGTNGWRWALWPALRAGAWFNLYIWHLKLPLWIPAATTLPFVWLCWRRHREALKGPRRCAVCRYDLSGLPPGSPCPECAAKAPDPPHH
jgi:hypothetical protein